MIGTTPSLMLPATYSRRRFLSTLALAAAVPSASHAVEETPTINLLVDKGGWGQSSPEQVRAVLFSAISELWKYCPGERMRPIRIYHRDDFPQTDFLHDWRGRVRIGIASQDNRWAQMAFQIGHEFCHCLAQHSFTAKRSWHPPQHASLWFEESLCETASLFVLRRLAETWRNASSPEWRNYVPEMVAFASDRLARPFHQLPADITFAAWFAQNESALRACAVLREKDVIIARQMLPLFEAEPAAWQAACFLNLGTRQPSKPLTQYFAEWRAASPEQFRPFLQKIAALFPSSSTAARPTS